jgi:hypothetical protein
MALDMPALLFEPDWTLAARELSDRSCASSAEQPARVSFSEVPRPPPRLRSPAGC